MVIAGRWRWLAPNIMLWNPRADHSLTTNALLVEPSRTILVVTLWWRRGEESTLQKFQQAMTDPAPKAEHIDTKAHACQQSDHSGYWP